MLKLIDVEAGYGPIPVLHGINIEVGKGEIITLIGANGAGKTTTLMAICGVIPPRAGDILLEGASIRGLPANRLVEMGISQVPEGRLIFSDLTVAENLDMGAFLRRDRNGIHQDLVADFAVGGRGFGCGGGFAGHGAVKSITLRRAPYLRETP